MKLPKKLYHPDDLYSMVYNYEYDCYQTSRPNTTVGKIGNSYPPKKKYSLNELLELGYKPKIEDDVEVLVTTDELNDLISVFVSKHEILVSERIKKVSDDYNVSFTKWGSRACFNALYDIIDILDEDNKLKVLEMIRNKKI